MNTASTPATPVRVDVWLWAVRVFRTRSAANDACRAGRVRIGEAVVKPAAKVRVGDEVFVRRGADRLHLRVEATLSKRVGAAVVGDFVEDLDPIPPRSSRALGGIAAGSEPLAGERERGAGRPTKRDRRRLDRLRGS